MSALMRAGGGVLAVLATVALAGSSRVKVPLHETGDARVRVAFSARPERIEHCRTLKKEELEALPAHMRQRVVCEGVTASYRLEIFRNGRLLDTALVRGGGLRHDRQLYVFRELVVPSGAAALEVRMTRLGGSPPPAKSGDDEGKGDADHEEKDGDHDEDSPSDDRERREVEEHRRRVADEVPALLTLSDTIMLAPREVALVTYDQEARRLRLKRGSER